MSVRRLRNALYRRARAFVLPSTDEGLQWVKYDPYEPRATRYECEF